MSTLSPNAAALRPANGHSSAGRRLLTAILLAAAILRLAWLTDLPPGLNQDEAANAWNSWCLLKTGHDQAGAPWPIFYTQALGGNSTTLFLYVLMPFQVLGGLNVWTTRLPGAIGGIATVALLYWVAARLFDRRIAAVAAALLAIAPWHIHLSRLGNEATLGPLASLAGLALFIWAGKPLCPSGGRISCWKMTVAGLLIGVLCYGYAAIRLFLPVFLLGCTLVTVRNWWPTIKQPRNVPALVGLATGLLATLGPLAYQHLVDPGGVGQHGQFLRLGEPGDSTGRQVARVAERYAAHFGPDFLWLRGDRYAVHNPAGRGTLSWDILPLALAGLGICVARCRAGPAARLALWWLLVYPIGDSLHRHLVHLPDGSEAASLHLLRSAPGLPVFALLAAIGAVEVVRWLARRERRTALSAAVAGLIAVLGLTAVGGGSYATAANRRPEVYHAFHADLMPALAWLRPRTETADAVFITAADMNMPYIVTLVGLGCDPRWWFAVEKDVRTFDEWEWEYYFRVGKFHFLYDRTGLEALDELRHNGHPDHVILIVRPDETGLSRPSLTVRGPDGQPVLLAFEFEL